jgi:hypothetical protein
MHRFRIALAALAAAMLAAAATAVAAPSTSVAFVAKYAGQASTKVDGNTATIAATGKGKGTLIGTGTITGNGTGDSSQQPCIPFGGLGKMTGTAGAISFKVLTTSNGCGDEGGHTFAIKGYATVLRATGKLAKAKGTLKFTGIYDHDGGTFTVKFTGTLKK